jgi:hypothetical protein
MFNYMSSKDEEIEKDREVKMIRNIKYLFVPRFKALPNKCSKLFA